MAAQRPTSVYLDSLPAVFRQKGEDFLGPFLLAFHRVLTGVGNAQEPGLEEMLEGIRDPTSGRPVLLGVHRYFDPGPGLTPGERTPEEFLDWLAGWVAISLRQDWSGEEKRRILAEAVPSYQRRGTKEGLRRVLAAYTGFKDRAPDIEAGRRQEPVAISELETPLQVGVTSTVGVDTVLGEGMPHYFRVRVRVAVGSTEDLVRQRQILHAIIDQEKPAHTVYDLELDIPTLQIAVHSTVGEDTVLGGLL